MIDIGADMDPITAAREFQFVELGETGADKAGGSRAVGLRPVPQRAARSRRARRMHAVQSGQRQLRTSATAGHPQSQ